MPSVAASICYSEVTEATEGEVNGCLIKKEVFQLLCLEAALLHLAFCFNLEELGVHGSTAGNK